MNSLSLEVCPSETNTETYAVSVALGSDLWTVSRRDEDFLALQLSFQDLKSASSSKGLALRAAASGDRVSASAEYAAYLRTLLRDEEALASDSLSDFLGCLKARLSALIQAGARMPFPKGLEEELSDDIEALEDENPQGGAAATSTSGIFSTFPSFTSGGGLEVATLLRMALTPYVPDVVFPTEAVLGCIADDLAEGRHGDAVDKVKAGLLAGNPSASAGNPPALARSPEEEVTGFVFVPGYAGVPPTPPSSPCPLEERSEGEETSLPSTGALIGEGFACPPSSPAPSEWPVWVDTDKLHARITAPCSSPAAGAGGQWDAQRYPVNAIRLAPQASYEVVLCGAAMEDD